jgi:hypothetical protein
MALARGGPPDRLAPGAPSIASAYINWTQIGAALDTDLIPAGSAWAALNVDVPGVGTGCISLDHLDLWQE